MSFRTFWPDRKQTLLLHAVLDEPGAARSAAMGWLAAVDFERLDPGSQRLLPMLSARLRELAIEHPLGARITGHFRRAWYIDQRLRRQLRIVRAAYAGARIDVILLKAAALGAEVYGHGALRPADDVDLLVRPPDFDRAANLLAAAGWQPDPGAEALVRHARTFLSEIGAIDLHISPFHETVRDPAIALLWADNRRVIVDGAPADLLAPHDQLLHTLTHGLRANVVPPIRWIADAILCIRHHGPDLDWARFALRAEQLRFTLVAHRGLAFLAREFAAPVPAAVLHRLGSRRTGPSERIAFHCERRRRFMPIAQWALTCRDAPDLGPVARSRMIAAYYRRSWQSASMGGMLCRAAVRALLGRRLSVWLYQRRSLRGGRAGVSPVSPAGAGSSAAAPRDCAQS